MNSVSGAGAGAAGGVIENPSVNIEDPIKKASLDFPDDVAEKKKEADRLALTALLNESESSPKTTEKKFSVVSLGTEGGNAIQIIKGREQEEMLYREADDARLSSDAGDIELVDWIPNLPQFFLFIVLTQTLLVMTWFIAYCSEPKENPSFNAHNHKSFQIITWIIFLLTSILFSVYMWFVKHTFLKMIVSTIFAMFAFLSLFHTPIHTSDSSKTFNATFSFFRGLFILIIGFLYVVAYREDIVPVRANLPSKVRNFVVRHRLDQP